MKKIILVFILISSFQLCFAQDSSDFLGAIAKKEREILNKEYVKFHVDTLSNKSLIGKVTIMNFWYEGCAPCIAEMEGLNKIYDYNKENKKFQFISFCLDDRETIEKNIEKFDIEYAVTQIERSQAYVLNYQSGFPVTIIIDTAGKVIHFSSGGPIDKTKATEKVMNTFDKIISKELLKER